MDLAVLTLGGVVKAVLSPYLLRILKRGNPKHKNDCINFFTFISNYCELIYSNAILDFELYLL